MKLTSLLMPIAMLHVCILLALISIGITAQDVACTAHIPLGTGARHYFGALLDPAKSFISLEFMTGEDPLLTARGFCALFITGNGSPLECVDQIMVLHLKKCNALSVIACTYLSYFPSPYSVARTYSTYTVKVCHASHNTEHGNVAVHHRQNASNVLQLS
jgi:hypothetical protein